MISRGRSRLKDIERWMCWAMRVVRDLRKISELEGDLDRECSELIWEVGFEIEEEIRKVEGEVAVGMAEMFLEEMRTLRTCRSPSIVHWW